MRVKSVFESWRRAEESRAVGCFGVVKARNVLAGFAAVFLTTAFLTGCGGPKISVTEAGKDYTVNDVVKVTAAYEQYNIQAPMEQVAADLTAIAVKNAAVKAHTVEAASKEANEGGKYDAVDTVQVTVEGADPYGVFPQKMEETYTYKRVKGTEEWEQTSAVCTKWDIDHKQIGGTAWQKFEGDKGYFLRLSGAVEYFYEDINATDGDITYVKFDTGILGAYAVQENGELKMTRFLLLSGSLTADGVATLHLSTADGVIDVVLNEYEKIKKTDLPFTEAEYQAVADNA